MSKYAHDLFVTTPRDPIDSIYFFVFQDERHIGTIDREMRFHFEAAPDLATFLAYAVASDGGRNREIYSFNPSNAAFALRYTLLKLEYRQWDDGTEQVYQAFARCFASYFIYDDTSRVGDKGEDFCYKAWQVAVREKFGSDLPEVDEDTFDDDDDTYDLPYW